VGIIIPLVLEIANLFSLSQNAALKLLTNAKTRDDCKVLYKPQRHFLMGAPGQHPASMPWRHSKPGWMGPPAA